MGYALQRMIQMEEHECEDCGLVYAAPEDWWNEKRRVNGSFYCPNGHARHFIGETDAQKAARLQRELEAAKSAQRFAETRLQNEQELHRKKLKQIEKRTHAGICPLCSRTFQQVARHMKSKHGKARAIAKAEGRQP